MSLPSEFLGDYTLLEKLGGGGTCSVYACKCLKTDKKFAVKILKRKRNSQKVLNAFNRELKALLVLNHENIIKLYNFYISKKRNIYYLIFDLCENGSLFNYLMYCKNNRINEFYSFKVIYTLINCIKHCHLKGIVHRDIKLENILLTKEYNIKLCDFGFSHYCNKSSSNNVMNSVLGSPHYMAPEILSGESYNNSCDYWSIGVLLYVLLCGKYPFFESNIAKLFNKIKKGEFSFSGEIWNEISSECKDFISNLLQINPKKRLNGENILNHSWIIKCLKSKNTKE